MENWPHNKDIVDLTKEDLPVNKDNEVFDLTNEPVEKPAPLEGEVMPETLDLTDEEEFEGEVIDKKE